MRISRALLAPCLLTVITLGTPGTAGAESPATIGGTLLSTRGVVVGEGAPSLPATAAAGWLVADLDTGQVLAARDPHGRYAPASTLKTLTALTLIPKLDPHQQVTPTFNDVNVDGSKVGLVQKVSYPVSQLFTAMLVVSGNDAANTLASANGGLDKTVGEMNAEADRIQAHDTHAATANGLDAPHQLSSAYDLALIARAGMQLPAFRDYVSTKHSRIRGPGGKTIAISSHDKLLYNYDGAIGIKNGYTVKARATFVGAATRGGHTLVVTLMRTNPRYWPEAAALLDWGFKAEAAGTTPIGELVVPVAPAEGTVAPTPTAVPIAHPARVHQAQSAKKAFVSTPQLSAGLISLGGLLVLQRLRRRDRGKLRLPPL
jgi:D-alanyl-D-alanine carboxypeptidase (penicillin-binding protein 5/6)